jgi:hypothetical protein
MQPSPNRGARYRGAGYCNNLEVMNSGDKGDGRRPRTRGDLVAGKQRGAAAPLEHVVSVWSETDIFHAVGLSYVPPHMRHFHSISS